MKIINVVILTVTTPVCNKIHFAKKRFSALVVEPGTVHTIQSEYYILHTLRRAFLPRHRPGMYLIHDNPYGTRVIHESEKVTTDIVEVTTGISRN